MQKSNRINGAMGAFVTAAGLLAALHPAPVGAETVRSAPIARVDTAIFAGGCFWGVEAVFEHIKGVKLAESGYAGGNVGNPSYEKVSSGKTGHAEVVRVVYDPALVTYEQLLHVFFAVAHDPTELNKQGPDHGTQYRSAIFFLNATQKVKAESYVQQLTKAKTFAAPIVTQIAPLAGFYMAEDYHQNYMEAHPTQPYIVYNDAPKVENLRKQFPQLYKGGR